MGMSETFKIKISKDKSLKKERKIKKSRFRIGKIITFGFWFFIVAVIYFSFMAFNRTGILNTKMKTIQSEAANQIKSMNKASFVSSAAGEDYALQFAKVYINIPADKNARDARNKNIQSYLANGLTPDQLENISGFNGSRNITDINLYKIKDVTGKIAVFQFRVKYDVVTTQPDNQPSPPTSHQVLLSIPIGTDDTNFNVIEQPSFESLPDNAQLDAVTNTKTNQDYKKSDAMEKFAKQFFSNYTENSISEMSYLMKEPSTLKGIYTFTGLENFSVYDGQQGQTIVKTIVDLKDKSGFVVKQPVTLTVGKQNGKYFVNKMTYTIGGN